MWRGLVYSYFMKMTISRYQFKTDCDNFKSSYGSSKITIQNVHIKLIQKKKRNDEKPINTHTHANWQNKRHQGKKYKEIKNEYKTIIK